MFTTPALDLQQIELLQRQVAQTIALAHKIIGDTQRIIDQCRHDREVEREASRAEVGASSAIGATHLPLAQGVRCKTARPAS